MFSLGFKDVISGAKISAIWSTNAVELINIARILYKNYKFTTYVSGNGIKSNSDYTTDGVAFGDHPIETDGLPNKGDIIFNAIYISKRNNKWHWDSSKQTVLKDEYVANFCGKWFTFKIVNGKLTIEEGKSVAHVAPTAAPTTAPTATPATAIAPLDKIIVDLKAEVAYAKAEVEKAKAEAKAANEAAAKVINELEEAKSLIELLRIELEQFHEEAKLDEESKENKEDYITAFEKKYGDKKILPWGQEVTVIKQPKASDFVAIIRDEILAKAHNSKTGYIWSCNNNKNMPTDSEIEDSIASFFEELPSDDDASGWFQLGKQIEHGNWWNNSNGEILCKSPTTFIQYCTNKSDKIRKNQGYPTMVELGKYYDLKKSQVEEDIDEGED